MRTERRGSRADIRTPHDKTDAERELELKGQVEGLLVVPIFLIILAWLGAFAKALGWW